MPVMDRTPEAIEHRAAQRRADAAYDASPEAAEHTARLKASNEAPRTPVTEYEIRSATETAACTDAGCTRTIAPGVPSLVNVTTGATVCPNHVADQVTAAIAFVWGFGIGTGHGPHGREHPGLAGLVARTAVADQRQAAAVHDAYLALRKVEQRQQAVAGRTDPRPICARCERRRVTEPTIAAREQLCGWCRSDDERTAKAAEAKAGPARARW